MNLSSTILTDILSRLSIKDHFTKSKTYLLLNNLSSSPTDSNYFSLVESQDDPALRHNLQQLPGIQLQLPKTTQKAEMEIVGSINGLVCICESSLPRNNLYIWNPILKECMTFQAPEFPESSHGNTTCYGFGLSSKKDEFKVGRISLPWTNPGQLGKAECHVYTLGETCSRSWKNIEIAKSDDYYSLRHAIFIEGNLHWMSGGGSQIIYCLDLDKETMEPFPSPPSLYEDYHKSFLNLYNGCLCVCDNSDEYDVKVWVMREYGVADSWSKVVVITEDPVGNLGNYFSIVHFVRVFNDGEILILLGNTIMFFRLPNGGTYDEVDARELVRHCETRITKPEDHIYSTTFEAVEFVPSLFSPVTLGEHVVKQV